MKNTLRASFAALGLFAAGGTFTAMNPAARPVAIVAQLGSPMTKMAAFENHHSKHTQLAAAVNDHAVSDLG